MDEPAPSVVVVGASAGGVEALTTLASELPEDLNAAVCVVLHLHPGAESRLAEIVSRAGALPAAQARGGERLVGGRIYVAPPDRHLIVRGGHVAVVRGPHENGLRPSIDVLFRSAALAYGRRAVAAVLSGTRDDGVVGACAIGALGGCVFVQDPDDSRFGILPAHTVVRDHPDRVLPLAELGSAIATAVHRLSEEADVRENDRGAMSRESAYATLGRGALDHEAPDEPSPYSCPECGGVLREVDDGDLLRYRCRVGHAYTAEGGIEGQDGSIETALWTALRALQERAALSDRLAERVGAAGAGKSRRHFEEVAEEARAQAETIRRVLSGPDGAGD